MKRKAILLAAAAGLLFSCTDKTVNQITQSQLAHIVALAYQSQSVSFDTVFTGCSASIYNVSAVPLVTLNSDTLLPLNLDYSFYEKYGIEALPGESLTLRVVAGDQVSSASVVQPGALVVTSPTAQNVCIGLGESSAVVWNRTSFAEWYGLVFHWSVQWYDTLTFSYHYTFVDTLAVTGETAITCSAGQLWAKPDSNWMATDWLGFYYLAAGSGTMPVAGEAGNVTGDGTGFLTGMYLTDWFILVPCYALRQVSGMEPPADRPYEDMLKRLFKRGKS
jgi:hypothetical protein